MLLLSMLKPIPVVAIRAQYQLGERKSRSRQAR